MNPWRLLPYAFLALLLAGICALSNHLADRCDTAGGDYVPSWTSRTGGDCVRDQVVIHP